LTSLVGLRQRGNELTSLVGLRQRGNELTSLVGLRQRGNELTSLVGLRPIVLPDEPSMYIAFLAGSGYHGC